MFSLATTAEFLVKRHFHIGGLDFELSPTSLLTQCASLSLAVTTLPMG